MAQRGQLDAASRRGSNLAIFGFLGLYATALTVVWTSVHGAAALSGDPAPTKNPITLLFAVIAGEVPWTSTATVLAGVLGVVLVTVAAVGGSRYAQRAGRRKRPDGAARHMARRKDLRSLSEAGARQTAERLGVKAEVPGVPLGKTVLYKAWLYSSWENMIVVVAGPRTMKSTAYAIPAIMAAPGALIATSNKRDVVDATREPRSKVGRVRVFDPQAVANEEPTWWWNPLTYIAPHDPATGRARRDPGTGWVDADETRAAKLAGQFYTSATPADAKKDAYFDSAGQNLMGLLLLAAAVAEEPITKVHRWLALPSDDTPIVELRAHGFHAQADELFAIANLTSKQRDGVYSSAANCMGFLRNRKMMRWVTPPADPSAPQFHPAEFARSTDTLYLLSKEGEGSAGPLVAALTVAVIDALEDLATASPGGRLTVPFLAVLDEAANICRFRNLDSYYSHFGSRGIIIITILQNWAQGEEVWGTKGMEKLWSAANVKVYGGGVDDDKFLRRISDLIGPYDHLERSTSRNRQGSSVSTSVRERTILTVAQLRELEQGRAIVFASGCPAVLIEPQPWFNGPNAGEIKESLATHTPGVRVAQAAPAPEVTSPWLIKADTHE